MGKKIVRILVLVSKNIIKHSTRPLVYHNQWIFNFQAKTNYIIPLERSCIDFLNGTIMGNVQWNYYHQKLKKP